MFEIRDHYLCADFKLAVWSVDCDVVVDSSPACREQKKILSPMRLLPWVYYFKYIMHIIISPLYRKDPRES